MNLSEGYGVLKCHAIAGQKELGSDTPHYQVHVKDDQFSYRLAINVRSSQKPFDLLYFIDDNFEHFITDKLDQLDFGFKKLEDSDRQPGKIALDYIRGNLFKVNQMKPLPFNVPGENNDLNELIDSYFQRAIETQAVVYAFGEPWGPENKSDKVFGFQPGRGVHNLHMNQGNSGSFARENGVYQDGALLIHYPSALSSGDHWVAVFFAFQSQSFHTDDRTGNPIDKIVGSEPVQPGTPAVKAQVKIIAALVNPRGEDSGKESVTLINSSPGKIELNGWAIADKLKRKQPLDGFSIEPGGVITVPLSPENIQLSNDGGILSILDSEGTKVDGVSYTKEDVKEQGWTLVFSN
ncbi:DUF2278 domain-containing protein [Brasilonema octagenarum UFV-E1]|uniref:DUF2278 domain-containing protein n=2 Tax=Brasilonema TaxID=383614 RepID=A0A856MG96_9CYAN|nr:MULTISPECIES: DUF2278 family protein [Brasilonema]NMF67148.1 DUF2278 domain-containing protein [Brasilonema octagenarum UFV-OR1]QDL10233.1 DUF2278 domain-containing protein [Brasilonema sennae CENA114]QDL16585.1 DUF2278 domain-containing protein [Brasilonema octagenarum UFV-E1]